ncbi:hypothetical protein ACIOZM_01510 [Pseudomonas sp. NPDC087346]|uniref:hypothetical protein n=1 Tax=Pseudomonas sp. NPDC087346 TaxID=3364438 RepID=UPI00380C55F3
MQPLPNLFNIRTLSTDQKERFNIADALKAKIAKNNLTSTDRPYSSDLLDVEQLAVLTVEDSDFYNSHRPANILLRRLVSAPSFVKIIKYLENHEDHWILVSQTGNIYQAYTSQQNGGAYIKSRDISTEVKSIDELKPELELLIQSARLTGGIVSSTDRLPLTNWLQFQQLDVPKTISDIENLIDYLKFLPFSPFSPPELGNYWGISGETGNAALIVPQDLHSIINQKISTLIENNGAGADRLINHLTNALPKQYSPFLLEESPDFTWAVLIETDEAKNFAQSCLDALDQENLGSKNVMTTLVRSRLLVAAVMIDLELATEEQRKRFHDEELYSPLHQNASVFEARNALKAGFVAIGVKPDTASLTLELVLSGLGPEFLVKAPASLQIGSVGWVMLQKSVMLAERMAPGLSRAMNYEQFLELSAISPVSSQQKTLNELVTLQCIVDWALINELNPPGSENLQWDDIVKNAAALYSAFTHEITDAVTAVSKQPVSRRKLAKKIIFDETLLHPEEMLFPVETGKWNPGHSQSALDLYLNSALDKDWDRKKGSSIAGDVAHLKTLAPINNVYRQHVEEHYDLFKPALNTMIRLALSRLPRRDRVALEHGKLALYQVLGSKYIPHHNNADEIASFGIVIFSWFDKEVNCYEVFPLQGLCLKNESMVRAYIGGAPFNEDAGGFENTQNGHNDNFPHLTYLQNIFADNSAYFSADKPVDHRMGQRTSRLLPENFRELDEYLNIEGVGMLLQRFGTFDVSGQPENHYPSVMESFNSERFKDIGKLIAEDNPPITKKQFYAMGYDKTKIEERDERLKKIIDNILDVIIPFKGCIEGLTSSDPDRRSGAVFGCIMDVIAVALVFVVGVGPFLKAAASSAKMLNLSKVVAGAVLSILNPLEGVPKLIQGSAKLAGRGVLKLSHYGHSVTRVGARQLKRLTNSSSGSYDLVKALGKTGAAAEIRMTLPTVAHARALFKDDTLETAEQILIRLTDKTIALPKTTGLLELEHLFNNAVIDVTRKLQKTQELEALIGRSALDDLLTTVLTKNGIDYNAARSAGNGYSDLLETVSEIETHKLNYMKSHQQNLLQQDLGAEPYNGVLPESHYNTGAFTDNAERAGAWIVHASNSPGNDLDSIVTILREYAASNKSLTDPNVIRQLHVSIAPATSDIVRVGVSDKKYASSISGFAVMQDHLKTLDTAHEHFSKQLLGAVVGFHGFGDGNGRTGRALYAISEIRNNRFNPLSKEALSALHGLD